jgi:integrase
VSADKALTPEEAVRLKAWAQTTLVKETTPAALREPRLPAALRNAAIVLVLLGTAARRFELCAFRCGDFFQVYNEPRVRFDEAKGNVVAEIAISDETWATVERWKTAKVAHGESAGPDAPLFCGRGGEYLSLGQLHNIWKTALKAAGLPTTYGVHASRHTAGMLLLQATQSLPQVCDFLRHASQSITEAFYKHMLPSDARAGLKKAGL